MWCLLPQLTRAQDIAADSSEIKLPEQSNLTDSTAIHDSLQTEVVVRSITIEGNKITRSVIILREIPFEQGDTIRIGDFARKFEEGENRLMNTSLFHTAKISVVQLDEGFADIKITVDERWYIVPSPHIKPVDRNISQWLFKERAKLDRVDYGAKLHWDNFTGNNDKLRFYFITGYTKQLSLAYRRPFFDKRLKWGVNVNLSVGKNHEIHYNTINDKQQFLRLRDKNFARNFFESSVELVHRPAFYTWHTFGIGYNNLLVHDSVIKMNPAFFKLPGNGISYPRIYYELAYRNLDYNPYPTKGYASDLELTKFGWDKSVNLWQLVAKGIRYWPINEKSFYSIGVSGALKLPFKQPFYFSELLGYTDMYLRGYEYYVMDGVAGGIVQANIAHRIVNFSLHLPGTKWFTPRLIPLQIYAKAYGNAGYAYNPEPRGNRLNNKMIYGGGVGFDVVTMYDFTLKIEFSFNQLGENGLYLQKKSTFQ